MTQTFPTGGQPWSVRVTTPGAVAVGADFGVYVKYNANDFTNDGRADPLLTGPATGNVRGASETDVIRGLLTAPACRRAHPTPLSYLYGLSLDVLGHPFGARGYPPPPPVGRQSMGPAAMVNAFLYSPEAILRAVRSSQASWSPARAPSSKLCLVTSISRVPQTATPTTHRARGPASCPAWPDRWHGPETCCQASFNGE